MNERFTMPVLPEEVSCCGPRRVPGRPRFSLILGTMGRTTELERFLRSLANQTYREFELIVVDQNLDDRLKPILAPHAKRYPVLHLRSERGLSKAKNAGLARASGDIVGFPDDDCQFSEDLLQRVARFFESHPEEDGLTGRAVDENGEDINSGFDRRAGRIDRFNVWRRGIAFNIFARRCSVQEARFDELMGPGAGTTWGAGDETDYLLQLLERGRSLFYDPALVVVHPRPQAHYDTGTLGRRAYAYARGGGRTVRKHGYPLWFKMWWVGRSLGMLFASAVGLGGPVGVTHRWHTLRGKVDGLRSTQHGRATAVVVASCSSAREPVNVRRP